MIATGTLKPKDNYLLTDYQTIQPIWDTIAWSENGVTISNDAVRNPALNGVESLMLTAKSTTELFTAATSPLRPKDEIDYDVTVSSHKMYQLDGYTLRTTVSVPGVITRRKDTIKNIQAAYDYLKVRMRRYKTISLTKDIANVASGVASIVYNKFAPNVKKSLMFLVAGTSGNVTQVALTKNGVTTNYTVPYTISLSVGNYYVFSYDPSTNFFYISRTALGSNANIAGKYSSPAAYIYGADVLGSISVYNRLVAAA